MTAGRFFIFVLVLAIAGFGSPAFSSGFKITFINPGGDGSFWGEVSKTMAAAAGDLDIDLEILNANRRPYAMEKHLQERLDRGDLPDYFVLVNELQEGTRLAKMLRQKPVKILFLLNTLSKYQMQVVLQEPGIENQLVASIIPDNETAGYEMAKSLISAARSLHSASPVLRVLALTGDESTPAALDREQGMLRGLAEEDNLELLRAIPVEWSSALAYARAKSYLARTTVDAIWAANDDIAIAAGKAAAELGLVPGKDIALVGLNWSRPGMDAVSTGALAMSHGGHFFAGAWAAVMLYDFHHSSSQNSAIAPGKAGSAVVNFKMSAITQENVGRYLEKLGDGDWSKIDFTQFSKVITGHTGYDFSAQAILNAAGN